MCRNSPPRLKSGASFRQVGEKVKRKVAVSRDTLIALSEGKVKFDPNIRITFGRYIIKRPNALVRWLGRKGKVEGPGG